MANALKSAQGVKVVKYSQARGKPEERTVWTDLEANEFVLMNNLKFVGKRKAHLLAELKTVTLGVPASELWRDGGMPPTPGAVEVTTRRLRDHVPDPHNTLRLRFAHATVDMAGYTLEETHALYAVLNKYATAPASASRSPVGPPRAVPVQPSSVVGPNSMGVFNSYHGDRSRPGPISVNNNNLPNGGGLQRKQRSTLRDMIQQPEEYDLAREAFLADDDLDNGVDAAAAALKPHTLAEVSGAVPQTPPCYVARPEETSRLVSALDPEYDGYAALGGATTVIFDSVANGKSVLAAAAMQDTRVQRSFPGGIIWLRAGRGAEGRLLRMMELAVCQVTEEMERSERGTVFRVPERFNNVDGAADYLASLLVRLSPTGAPRETLLVLDDVWEIRVVEAFETVGFSILVTTREPSIARLATPHPSGGDRFIGPLGPLEFDEATSAVAKAAVTRRAPREEAAQLLERTGQCPLAVGVVGATLKQAQSPKEWVDTSSKVKRTCAGLHKRRKGRSIGLEEEVEDRIIASIAAGLSNMPEENQMLYSALCILPPGLPVTCRLLEQVWETGKRTTILAAEAFEHRRLLDRLGPGNFVLHYEAARFLQNQPGPAGDGAWVGSKLRGHGRELAFNRLAKHLDSFDTLRDHLAKRDLWSLKALWSTCEAEARKTSGHMHVSCRLYESRLELLRQEAVIVAGPGSRARVSKQGARKACEATLDLAQALDMVADFQAYGGCSCDAAPLYMESIDSLQQSLELTALQGSTGARLESRVRRALERITGKLGALLLKQGKARDALHPCAEALSLTRARQGTEGPDGAGGGANKSPPHQDVVDSLYSMADALMIEDSVDEAEGLHEEAVITLRRLYGDEPSLSLEARGAEHLAGMMLTSGLAMRAFSLNDQSINAATKAFGDTHPVLARLIDQKADVLIAQGDFHMSAKSLEESRQIREAFYGRGHALVAPSLLKQALLHQKGREYNKAADLLKECLLLQENRYGQDDDRVDETKARLAEVQPGMDWALYKQRSSRTSIRVIPALISPEEDMLRANIEVAEARAPEDGGREASVLLGRLAKLLRDAGESRIEDCEAAYQRWVDRLQTKIGNQVAGTDEEMSEALRGLMDALDQQGKDLEKVMFDVLDLSKQLHGKVSIELADDMERFGRYLVNKERYSVAEALLRQSLTIKEKKRGRDHAELAGILRTMGRVLFEVNALQDAAQAFERALTIDQQENAMADVVEDMRSLGMVYCRQGANSYERAEAMYRRVVEMDKTLKGGEEDPSVITEMNVLSVLLYAQGKMEQAEPLLKKVLALRERVLGPNHADVAESLVNLAVLHNKKGNYWKALPMLNNALEILRKANGDRDPETVACLSWIAETHQKQGQYFEAEKILLQVVAFNRELLGDDDPRVADSLTDLAELLRAQGKLDEAERAHLEAIDIRERKYGEEHETVAQSAQYLSLLLQNAGREAEADEYQRRVVAIKEVVAETKDHVQRQNVGRGPSGRNDGYGENARKNHAKVAVERSIANLSAPRPPRR